MNLVAFSPDGALTISGSSDEIVKLKERSTGNLIQNFEGHTKYVNSVAFSTDGAFIVSVSSDETVKLCER